MLAYSRDVRQCFDDNISILIMITDSWPDVRNRRKFFEAYARRQGFDPLVAVNWYSQSRDKILAVKV